MSNEIFQQNVRNHTGLIDTSATHQIIRCYAAGLRFSYAWSAEDAQAQAKKILADGPHNGMNNNKVSVEIRERGNFVPHYEGDE